MAQGTTTCAPASPGRPTESVSSWLLLLLLLAALLQQFRHHSRPSRLMAGAQALSCVSVKVFVKEHQVAPVRIGLEALVAAVDRAAAVTPQEDGRQPPPNLPPNLPQVHHLPPPSRPPSLQPTPQIL